MAHSSQQWWTQLTDRCPHWLKATVRDWPLEVRMRWWFWRYDHTEAYRRLMAYRINRFGPEQSVGGFDLGIGELQLDFLMSQGLTPGERVLDLGCGVLRAGRHFLRYLDAGNYTGMDISRDAIEEGKRMVGEKTLRSARPTFIVNDDLRFREFDREFDYIIANSVFTHLPREPIAECFEHVDRVLPPDGVFYATFFDKPQESPKNFAYQPQELVGMADDAGLAATVLDTDEYPHPRDQRMLELRPANSGGESG